MFQEVICRTGFETIGYERKKVAKISISNGETEVLIATGVGDEVNEVRDRAIIGARLNGLSFIEISEPVQNTAVLRKRDQRKHREIRYLRNK